MIFQTQHKSIEAAVKYFDTVLSQGDYYLGTEIEAHWHGATADILGLEPNNMVTRKEFQNLLSGLHPKTGVRLAQRMRSDRRPGTDITLSVPKSVSLAWAINQDERILDVLREAVHETMKEDFEPLVHRRVRDGANVNTVNRKHTGNFVYADFLHKTSRPVDSVPDPHLHVHCFLANLTAADGKFYAAEFNEIVRQLPSLQAKFDSRVACNLEAQLGYEIRKVSFKQSGRMKQGWELAGVARDTIEKFSRRTQEIEELAAASGISDADEKAELGRRTRKGKESNQSVADLQSIWADRLTGKEREAFAALRAGALGAGQRLGSDERLGQSVKFSVEHHLYRQSTVERHQIVGTALEHGVTLRPEAVEAKLKELDVIARSLTIDGAQRHFVTTREVLQAERRMLDFAIEGMGSRFALGPNEHVFTRDWLNDQQRGAVDHVLRSRDTVTLVTGGAGTGKTALMKETTEAIEKINKKVFTFAPTTGAREVLKSEGFENAETVEHLLRNDKLHAEIGAGDALFIDEAGLLDVRTTNAIFDLAQARNARVVLLGDARQHSSPRRGEALRLLQTEGNLNAARVDKIQRQKNQYKRAVELVSRGHEIVDPQTCLTGLAAGFDLLNTLGKVKEIASDARHEVLAEHYMDAIARGKSTLVVAPTHAEGKAVTQELRARLRAAGALGKEVSEKEFAQLRSINLTDAEKREASSYAHSGQIVQFHQSAKGFKRGERYYVRLSPKKDVVLVPIDKPGTPKQLPVDAAERFEVYSEETIRLTKGDKLRFSLGGKAKDGKRRISNGRLDEVAGFDRGGNVRLKSGMVVDRNYAHWDQGYCVTSHASQGKTVDVVLAAMGSQSLPAINAKQAYVTVSRGSKDVMIFVDDIKRVRRAIHESGNQLSATELIHRSQEATARRRTPRVSQRRMFVERIRHWWRKHRTEHASWGTRQVPTVHPIQNVSPKPSR